MKSHETFISHTIVDCIVSMSYHICLTESESFELIPFPAVVLYTRPGMVPRVAGRPDGPCGPRAPIQSLWGAGPGTGCPLEARGPKASLGSFRRSARTMALAVRVV